MREPTPITLSCEQNPNACFECLTVTATFDDGTIPPLVIMGGRSKAEVFAWLSEMVRRAAPKDADGFRIVDTTDGWIAAHDVPMATVLDIFAKNEYVREHCIVTTA